MIHIALIGAGGHSLACHAPALRRYAAEHPDRVSLAAICDLNLDKAKQAAHEFGFARACASTEELFASADGRPRIDALVAVLPIPAMLASTGPLLKRGLPMVIEKPLENNIGEARALAEMIKRGDAGGRVMLSFNRRFDPSVTMAMEWMKQQGPMRHVRGTMVRSGRTEPDFVWGTGIHLIDLLNHVAGPLVLEDVRRPGKSTPSDGWRVATLRGRDGAHVTLEIMPTGGTPWVEQVRIAGDEYCMDIHTGGSGPPWRVQASVHGRQVIDAASPAGEPPFVSNGTFAETVAFLDAVCERKPLPASGIEEALASSELAARIQSMDTG